jgi:hypothetical protein
LGKGGFFGKLRKVKKLALARLEKENATTNNS